jgi:hypothetical protein
VESQVRQHNRRYGKQRRKFELYFDTRVHYYVSAGSPAVLVVVLVVGVPATIVRPAVLISKARVGRVTGKRQSYVAFRD